MGSTSGMRLIAKAKKGFRGYPIATVAYYGPDDKRASKIVVGIIRQRDAEPDILKKWFSDDKDLRYDEETNSQILKFIDFNKAQTVSRADRIIGCPHQEGIDYPLGEVCPQCPFWAGRKRWPGVLD